MLHQSNREMPLKGETNFRELKKKYSKGIEIKNKKLGIIGFGRIGQLVAKIGIGLGMEILAFDKYINDVNIKLNFFNNQSIDFNIQTTDIITLLKSSDFISVHTPKLEKPITDTILLYIGDYTKYYIYTKLLQQNTSLSISVRTRS